MFAGLAAVAASLDPYLMPLGTPVAIVLGIEALVDAALAVAPAHRPWSAYRRDLARVAAAVWLGLAALALGLGMAATACACTTPTGYVPSMLAGVDPHDWVALGAIAGPVLLGLASVSPPIGRPSPPA